MPKPKLSKKVIKQENLWATPYWYTQIWDFMRSETRVTFNEDFTNWIESEMKKKSVVKSNRGGWQSDLYDSKNNMFEPLINEIREFCSHLPLDIKEIIIPQLWVNVNKRNNWNIIHQHAQYDLSGTYYVKVPKDSGRLVFRDPRPGAIGNKFMINRFDKGELKNVNVMEGMLGIWPAYLDHFVEPSNTDEERISISFDIIAR